MSDAPVTRLGQLVLTGEVVDAEPPMRQHQPLRVMGDYVLSVVFDGYGHYQHADGRQESIEPGAVTLVEPGQPHWYGTAPGGRWTELFAVFIGPLFDTLARVGVIAGTGPRYPRPSPAMGSLRTMLAVMPSTRSTAEHQLLALAAWLVEVSAPTGPEPSPQIAAAVERLSADLAAPVDLRTLAAEVGLGYDTFRRRFTAEIGTPPLAFRNTRRLQAAATMLRLTDMTIRAIARTLGYTDEFHLSRRFHAHYGRPPSDYRHQP